MHKKAKRKKAYKEEDHGAAKGEIKKKEVNS